MKMASFGMGATRPRPQTVLRIVIPTAIPGILTGVMLALARAMGETAPLLFTALFSGLLVRRQSHAADRVFVGAHLQLRPAAPSSTSVALTWAASLVLVEYPS